MASSGAALSSRNVSRPSKSSRSSDASGGSTALTRPNASARLSATSARAPRMEAPGLITSRMERTSGGAEEPMGESDTLRRRAPCGVLGSSALRLFGSSRRSIQRRRQVGGSLRRRSRGDRLDPGPQRVHRAEEELDAVRGGMHPAGAERVQQVLGSVRQIGHRSRSPSWRPSP